MLSSTGSTVTKRMLRPDRGGTADIISHCQNEWLPLALDIPESFPDAVTLRNFLIDHSLVDPFFCLSLARACVETASVSAEQTQHFLQTADADSLKRVMAATRSYTKNKQLTSASPIQSKKVQQTVMAVAAARVLSQKLEVSENTGFLVGIVPMLGHLLYSWNYPTLYATALARSRKTKRPVEEALTTMLKMSPQDLATRITRSWQISRDTQIAIDGKAPPDSKLRLIERSSDLITTFGDPHSSKERKDEFSELRTFLDMQYSFDVVQSATDSSKLILQKLQKIHPQSTIFETTLPPEVTKSTSFTDEQQPHANAAASAETIEEFLYYLQGLFRTLDIKTACLYRYDNAFGERLVPLITILNETAEKASTIAPLAFHPLADALFSQTVRVFTQRAMFNKKNYFVTSTSLINNQLCLLYVELPDSSDSQAINDVTRSLRGSVQLIKNKLESFIPKTK